MGVFKETAFGTTLRVVSKHVGKNERLCEYGFGALYKMSTDVYSK